MFLGKLETQLQALSTVTAGTVLPPFRYITISHYQSIAFVITKLYEALRTFLQQHDSGEQDEGRRA